MPIALCSFCDYADSWEQVEEHEKEKHLDEHGEEKIE